MSEASAPRSRGGSVWAEAAADPTVRAIVLYALVAVGAVVAAYGAIFAGFANYDDEGTVLVTLNAFAHGQPLYTDIFSPTGPSSSSSSAVSRRSAATPSRPTAAAPW